MSVPDISALFDVLQVKRTELMGDAKSWIAAFFKTPDKGPDDKWDDPCDESAPVDWWQHYGFVSRPPAETESLLLRFGANVFAIASRTLAAAGIFGQLAEGDTVVYSLGKNLIKLGVDGSITAMKETKSGETLIITIGADDSLKGFIPNGPWFEMSKENGVTISSGSQPLTLTSQQSVQIVSPVANIAAGAVKLGIGATVPMATAFTPPPTAAGAASVFI